MNNKLNSLRKSMIKGLSIIEAVIALALSSIFISGVIIYYQSALDNQKSESTSLMLASLVSVINTTYYSQKNFEGISESSIIKTGALPDYMVDGQHIYMPGGSRVNIKQGDLDDESKVSYFNLSFGVSKGICKRLSLLDFGHNLLKLYIGDKSHVFTKRLTPGQAVNACDQATLQPETSGGVLLYYVFYN